MRERINKLGKEGVPFLFVIDFEMEKPLLIPLDEINGEDIKYTIGKQTNTPEKESFPANISFSKTPISIQQYKKAFNKVLQHLRYGNSYLVNLTFPTPIECNLTTSNIYHLSQAPYKLFIKNKFVVFSPEPFIRIKNGQISSYPMKGTIDATIPDAREKLLSNQKEYAEHATIVDLIRNDMSLFANHVKVRRFRYIDHISTNNKPLLQMSSSIEGKLPANYKEKIGDVLYSMLPAGSISGAPKQKTLEIIKESEISPRGYYTGIAGIFDGNNLESFVIIRYIEEQNGHLVFKSGGGITAQSIMEEEYNELIDKVYLPFEY